MNEGLPINDPKNQSQEISIEREIEDPGEMAETTDEIVNLQEALPNQLLLIQTSSMNCMTNLNSRNVMITNFLGLQTTISRKER